MANIKFIIVMLTVIILFILNPAWATDYKFADKETAINILTKDDEYLSNMKPIEIALQTGSTTANKTIEDLKAHYAANVIEWPEAEKALMKALLITHKKKLEKISHLLPDTVYFIKVTNAVESGIPHTRGNAFVSPARRTSLSTKLFFHQIFHILSRKNRIQRASLYNIIGFRPCYFQSTEKIDRYTIRNPEAPFMEFFLPVKIEDRDTYVMSYLHTKYDAFDPKVKKGFDGHITGDLLEVILQNGICKPVIRIDGSTSIFKHEDIPDFYKKVGYNTKFDIHPEEIIADNFAYLMMKTKNLTNPEIPEKIEDWLDVSVY